ncbi:MAG: glycosyltransferase [Acidobacteria bacterium]|nr:glycosyltransferase [Acidobacteriota bacterium]
MLRLCYIANADSVHSHRWISYFAERGHTVHWVSLSACTSPVPDGVDLHLVGSARGAARRPVPLARSAWRVRSLLRRIRPDLVHAHYAGVNGIVAAQAGVRPLMVTAWGSDVLCTGRRRIVGLPVRAALRRADRVTCDAEHMRRQILAMGVRPERLDVIGFGTDTDRFQPTPPDSQLAAEVGVAGRPTVISLRNFHPVYDVGTLIRAIPLVREQVPHALFLLAGAGPEEPVLRRTAAELGAADAVRFLGPIAPQRLPAYLALADVYVSTSRSDAGIAASTAEAMACGLPVVVTDSGENDRWIVDGRNGYLVPVGGDAPLADAIVRLLRDRGLRRACGDANRAVIVERNSFRTEMAKVEALYYDMTSRVGRPS